MKCLSKYKWVKLYRAALPQGKGIMGYWARLAGRAAFRQGNAQYCGYTNTVTPGMWSGGIVGLKSILGVKRRSQALQIMNELQHLGYISYSLDRSTKKLSYEITDWIQKETGTTAGSGTVYATEGYGFICMPRCITEKLAVGKRIFDESDAWLDLWCHTVHKDYGNAFSFLAPVIQYGKYGCALTLEQLGHRWGWGKTKVWRFFQKNSTTFGLQKLPGSYGCLIFNLRYTSHKGDSMPSEGKILFLLDAIRKASRTALTAWISRILMALTVFAMFKLAPANDRYKKTGIQLAIVLILTIATELLNTGAVLTLIAGILSIVAEYQEYHGHSELIEEKDHQLSGKWTSLFMWSIVIGLILGFASTAAGVLAAVAGVDTETAALVIAAVMMIPEYIIDIFYILYLKKMIALFAEDKVSEYDA